jgi:hypothetical protein
VVKLPPRGGQQKIAHRWRIGESQRIKNGRRASAKAHEKVVEEGFLTVACMTLGDPSRRTVGGEL